MPDDDPHAAGARSRGDGEPAGGRAPLRRGWRKWRWLVRLIVGVPVVVGVLALLLMRSPLVGYFAARRIAELSGCTLRSGHAHIELDGRLVINDPVLAAPGVPGEGGTVLSAERAIFDLDWSGVFVGEIGCTAVR